MDIVDVSENELNSYLASLLPKLIFLCLVKNIISLLFYFLVNLFEN